MGLNVDFQTERKKIEWQGQFAVEVRGLTPNDIVRVIAENPAEADAVLGALDGDVRERVDAGDDATAIADAISGNAVNSFAGIAAKAPLLIAKLIAVAADSPDDWQVVKERFVLPLQFDILKEVAQLTFVDPPGFRRFVGNVMALIEAFKPDQRQNVSSAASNG